MQRTQRQIMVSTEIMKSLKISIEELQSNLAYLGHIFGARLRYMIPDKINDLPTLSWIVSLTNSMRKLEGSEGFGKHVNTYTRTQLRSSYFVTCIARWLLDKGIDSVAFDPLITVTGRKPDILATFQAGQVYIECKSIETTHFDYSAEHGHMLSILRSYIRVPHQVDIRYRNFLSDVELHELGKTLQDRLSQIRGGGKIIDNDNLEVQVQIREGYFPEVVNIVLGVIMEDLNDKCRYPEHCYGVDGHSIAIAGPKVDYSSILRSKVRKSRIQSPNNRPFVLMIDANSMLGSLTENIRALTTAFQPGTNTRFSAAALVEYTPRWGSFELDFKFYFIPNPFAKFPVRQEFERLFSTSSEN